MTARMILGEHAAALEVRLTEGDGATLAGTLVDPSGDPLDWPDLPTLEFSARRDPDAEVVASHVATVDEATATWTLSTADVAAIAEGTAGRYSAPETAVRITLPDDADGRVEWAGLVNWRDGWTPGERNQRVTFTLPGPPGRGVVSITDPDATGTATITYTDGTTALLPLPCGGGGGSDEALRAELRAATTGNLIVMGSEFLVSALPDAEAGEFPLGALYDVIGATRAATFPLSGGVEGQILTRRDDAPTADYDAPYQWDDPPVALPSGGTTGQLLAKASDDDGDAEWTTVPIVLPEPTGADRAAIQAALDSCKAQGGGIVRAREGRTYTVHASSSTLTLRNASGSASTVGYCLRLPVGVTLDLQGSTLLHSGGDARMVINETPGGALGTTTDADLGIINGTLDAGAQQFTNAQLVTFVGCRRLTLDNLHITNGKGGGVLIYNDQDGTYDRLSAADWAGNAYNFGNPNAGAGMREAHIGTKSGRNIAADTVSPFTYPGNLLFASLTRSTVGSVECVNTAGGVKFDAGSDTAIGQCVYKGGPLATTNSGIKLQGYDATLKVRRLTVGSVIAEGCSGSGLYIGQHVEDCVVQSYIGEGNSPTGSAPDVWLDGVRNHIGLLRSSHAGVQALQVRPTADSWRVDVARVRNAGASSGSVAVAVASANAGSIGKLEVVDDRSVAATSRGLSIDAAAAVVEVGSLDIRGVTQFPVASVSPNVLFGPLRAHASAPMVGQVTLTAGTATTVTNGNVRNDAFGSYLRTVVRLTPLNAAARALHAEGTVYVVPDTGAFTIKHVTAAGTEVFRWEIVGLIREAFNLT